MKAERESAGGAVWREACGGGGGEGGRLGAQKATCVRLELGCCARLNEGSWGGGGWMRKGGGGGGRKRGGGCPGSRAHRGAVLPRSARVRTCLFIWQNTLIQLICCCSRGTFYFIKLSEKLYLSFLKKNVLAPPTCRRTPHSLYVPFPAVSIGFSNQETIANQILKKRFPAFSQCTCRL